MATDRDALRVLMAEQGQEAVMDRLEPFFRKADRGFYDLAGLHEVEGRLSADCIRCMGRGRLQGFEPELVSFEDVARTAAVGGQEWDVLAANVDLRIRQVIGHRYEEKLNAYLGQVMRRRLGEVLWPTLGFSLWHSFQDNRWDVASQTFKLEVKGLVLRTIEYYVGFSLAGDADTVADLAPLVDTLGSAIILGRREGTKDRYITIVA